MDSVFSCFQFAANLIIYVFSTIFVFLNSSDFTKPIVYVFIIGVFVSVLLILISGGSRNE